MRRWNGRVEQNGVTERRDASRTPQFAAPTRAQLSPAPAGSAARGVRLRDRVSLVWDEQVSQIEAIGVAVEKQAV
jgi:hypothetical protein